MYGEEEALVAQFTGLDGYGKGTAYGLERAVKTQLAYHHHSLKAVGIYLFRTGQNSYGHREVVATAFLAYVCGGKVYHHLARRILHATVFYGCHDALVALLDGAVGQTYKDKSNAAGDVDFDADWLCFESLHAGAVYLDEHGLTLSLCLCVSLAEQLAYMLVVIQAIVYEKLEFGDNAQLCAHSVSKLVSY